MIYQNSTYLKITPIENDEFKISTGTSKDFNPEHILVVGKRNPNLLWNLLYEIAGLPLPVHMDPRIVIKEYIEQEASKSPITKPVEIEPSIESIPQKEMSDIEKELSTLSSKDIVYKVFNEKGIQITNSLKSKAAIIKKALKIYEK